VSGFMQTHFDYMHYIYKQVGEKYQHSQLSHILINAARKDIFNFLNTLCHKITTHGTKMLVRFHGCSWLWQCLNAHMERFEIYEYILMS